MHPKWLHWGICLLLLSGCTGTSGATSSVTPTASTAVATPAPAAVPLATGTLTTIDWANTTYPDVCQLNGGKPVSVSNGRASGNGLTMTVTDPIFGYLTRTNAVDAIIPYECFGANGFGTRILIFAGDATQPVVVGQLPLTGGQYPLTSVFNEGIVQHKLELSGVGYSSSSIPHCCPDVWVIDIYSWNGSALILSGHQATQLGGQLAS